MYKSLTVKGETWELNQNAPFLVDGVVAKITEIYEDETFIGIELSINNSGEIITAKVPIVNKEIEEGQFETVPSRVSIKEEKIEAERQIERVFEEG